ncbi:MAG: hypothetical protein IJJ23_08970 [Clostridia bacterium]|nr:hypothetical protein [Clostridia bacterium]
MSTVYDRISVRNAEDLFLPHAARPERGVYFVRVCETSDAMADVLWRFHEAARQRGVIIEDKIANPDSHQLDYYRETMGDNFEPDAGFVQSALSRWMPRMSAPARSAVAEAILRQIDEMKASGKPLSAIKNAYIKIMCWLYYRFERIMPLLDEDQPPRILYVCSGSVTAHELTLLSALNLIGADIMMVELKGDQAYLRIDPQSRLSQLLPAQEGHPFSADFNLKAFRAERASVSRPAAPARQAAEVAAPASPDGAGRHVRLKPAQGQAGHAPRLTLTPELPTRRAVQPAQPTQESPLLSRYPLLNKDVCVNAWLKEPDYKAVLQEAQARGDDLDTFYSAFIRVRGARNRVSYATELYQLYRDLKDKGRSILVIDGALPVPQPHELDRIRRRPYRSSDEIIVDLAGNLPASASKNLQRLMQRAFVSVMAEAAAKETNLHKLTTMAVYLLVWINRYQSDLFTGFQETALPVLLRMGACADEREALYFKFLARIPCDVLIFVPDRHETCALQDSLLVEVNQPESLEMKTYPRASGGSQIQTVAAMAQNDLNAVLYTGDGLYRDRQFATAEAVTLKTTYDELFILWDQELRLRPSFSSNEQTVSMPVIWARVSGVPGGKLPAYWQRIKHLSMSSDAVLIPALPDKSRDATLQPLAAKAIRNGRILWDVIRADRRYPFGILSESAQRHIFDKAQQMLDRRLIRGTFENGMEYNVLATVLGLDKAYLRIIQRFDFTRKNPKVVAVSTGEKGASVEDAIVLTLLHLIGFDVIFFVPTGYQTIEQHLNGEYPVEHTCGEYLYDLRAPDFSTVQVSRLQMLQELFNSTFRRGV